MTVISPDQQRVGDLLRHWRKTRHVSQMDAALSANVSPRHLSFVENGRAQPSYELLERLAVSLQMPLKHANLLFIAAGYAPRYTDLSLDDTQMVTIRQALTRMLDQHQPFPAFVLDRSYDIVMQNAGFERLVKWLLGDESALHGRPNLYRLMFAEWGLHRYFLHWESIAPVLLRRLYEESIAYQSAELARIHAECAAITPTAASAETSQIQQLPVLTFSLQKQGTTLSFFSTMTTFGSAIDVTVQELRVESMFPVDDMTRAFFTQADA